MKKMINDKLLVNQKRMSSNNDIIIEAKNIKFCPGPCNVIQFFKN